MKITFLGTGTSHGVPMAGCDCKTCTSKNPKNRRYRSSVLIQENGKNVLIDIPAEFRLAAIENRIKKIDAVLITHGHADHIAGLDDIRRYNEIQKSEIPFFCDDKTADELRQRFSYIFKNTQDGGGKPRVKLNIIEEGNKFDAARFSVIPLPVMHGNDKITGFRVGDFAYITDVSMIPGGTFALLKGLKVLALDALRPEPHPTHFNLEQALQAAAIIGAERTFFIHIAHRLEHEELEAGLPENIRAAYDGLGIEL
ncbi:MAG TPA: MBL fold metallo-hydrolase [bacterium]|nr:MBL fold metallo-hydrolase [bacterium]